MKVIGYFDPVFRVSNKASTDFANALYCVGFLKLDTWTEGGRQ